jgi:GNAT superfamily N-acetyltransferase
MVFGSRSGVEVRTALPADTLEIAGLLRQLGLCVEQRQVAERVERLLGDPFGTVLVATAWNGAVSALIALHWNSVLQADRPVAQITALVVDEAERRNGIGRLLIKAASQAARTAGCDQLTIATEQEGDDLASFCGALGFTAANRGFVRSLRKRSRSGAT